MTQEIDIKPLFEEAGIPLDGAPGTVDVTEGMSGLEAEPKQDWLYYGLSEFKALSQSGKKVRSAALIVSGNGIDAIALPRLFPGLEALTVTDILPEILPQIKENIERNTPVEFMPKEGVRYAAGRDCEPLEGKVDLIYGNLPLVTVDSSKLGRNLSTTTLTDSSAYARFGMGSNDVLERWSLLSQLGFLISAKRHLNEKGIIITELGGRVPYAALAECFKRTGLDVICMRRGIKRQSDPQFLSEYAEHESRIGEPFTFYDDSRVQHPSLVEIPSQLASQRDIELRKQIAPARISAARAYEMAIRGEPVCHIAYSFQLGEG